MDKAHIIAEIQRTAAANGGKPLGRVKFEAETGITLSDFGKFWARWGDALAEAGYEPNKFLSAYDDDWVIEQMIEFIRELGRYPAYSELRLRSFNHPTFPSRGVFLRVGKKAQLAGKIVDYCSAREGFDDIIAICRPVAVESNEKLPEEPKEPKSDDPAFGYVYLFKSGKHYKIGHSNSAGRREYELAIQLPEKLTTVHTISTDDPVGIEDYWHRRFAAKRLNGEWFNLDAADIRAFKRRKFM